MADKKLQLIDLFSLSDALQMELQLDAANKVRGERPKVVEIPEIGVKMNLKVKVVSSRVSFSTGQARIALILHVQGDLYILATSDRKTGRLNMIVLDQSKTVHKFDRFFEDMPSLKMSELLKMLVSRTAVAAYERGDYDSQWEPMPQLSEAA